MKDKISPLEVSILSSYMGRWLTAILAVFVVAVAISALVQGRHATRNIIDICVATDQFGDDPSRVFEPLRDLVAAETRRPTTVSACGRGLGESDLYILSLDEFVRHEPTLGLQALFEVVSGDRADKAVVIVRGDDPASDLSSLTPPDVLFADPSSLNGFMVQMSMLGHEPDGERSAEELSFAGKDAVRTVLAVVNGTSRAAACRLSQVERLIEQGVVGPREVKVIAASPALPETLVAARGHDAEYYRRKLRAIASLLDEAREAHSSTVGTAATTQRVTLRLLRAYGVKGFVPADAARLQKARELHANMAERFSSASQ